ncbi:glycoside hydrolase family 16 protein [Actinoplanes sp. NPDC051346]|uniref:glycoside hydrolase family 16 protein n=1 Tax=Actinoplanes sp. NPDC051346 TaxID=3155048 RepID=UPI003416797C
MKRARRWSVVLSSLALLAGVATEHPGVAVAAAPPAPSSGVLFDDFQYDGPSDPRLAARGWSVRTAAGGPGPGKSWSADAVSFPADASARGGRVMRLRATTDGTVEGTVRAQVNTAQSKFFTGTYAARVFFHDRPTTGDGSDPSVQAFYTISAENRHYSELDHEYLPHGGFGAPGPALHNTVWKRPDSPDAKKTSNTRASLHGWHTVAMTADNGVVDFSIDWQSRFRSTELQHFPRTFMSINFNNWFDRLVDPGQPRAWEDPCFGDGDRIDDIALFRDYGDVGADPGCCMAHQAVFVLAADPSGTGAFTEPTTAWQSRCFGNGTASVN